jgi:hypothetical protein
MLQVCFICLKVTYVAERLLPLCLFIHFLSRFLNAPYYDLIY